MPEVDYPPPPRLIADLFVIPGWILQFIDWLNEKVGADKKKKRSGEQMATLEELFEGYENRPRPPRPLEPPGYTTFTK